MGRYTVESAARNNANTARYRADPEKRVRYHANSANNYLDVLRRADKPVPGRIAAKAKMLQQCGWRIPQKSELPG